MNPTNLLQCKLETHIFDLLDGYCLEFGITREEALKRCILTEAYVQREILRGSTIMVMDKDGYLSRLKFNPGNPINVT